MKTMAKLTQKNWDPKCSRSHWGSIQLGPRECITPQGYAVGRVGRDARGRERHGDTPGTPVSRVANVGEEVGGEVGEDMGEGAGAEQVGVGPWPGPWPAGDHWDPDLLRDGDRRNVVDRYRYWRLDAIVADLDTRRHDFHVAVENWGHDFNIGSVDPHRQRVQRRGLPHRRQAALEPAGRDGDRPLPARAPPPGRRPTSSGGRPPRGRRPRHTARSASTTCPARCPWRPTTCPASASSSSGRRARGCPRSMRAACEVVLHIEQFGSTRSINAGAAAAIAMHAWVRRHVFAARLRPPHRVDLWQKSPCALSNPIAARRGVTSHRGRIERRRSP